MNVAIISSIIGNYDTLKPIPTDLPCYLICDRPPQSSPAAKKQWIHKPYRNIATSNERQARMPKCLAHQFVGADITIWVDGKLQFNQDPANFLKYLDDGDIAVYPHPSRNCTYQEAKAVIKFRKAPGRIVRSQMHSYRQEGFPKNFGLANTQIIIRRHTPQTNRLGEAWWSELTRWSSRDQLSFDYVCWRHGIKWIPIKGKRRNNKIFTTKRHTKKERR